MILLHLMVANLMKFYVSQKLQLDLADYFPQYTIYSLCSLGASPPDPQRWFAAKDKDPLVPFI
jgi:hypothetical protein